ncbi:helix-turn-helix transcriptional regulator [Bacillaceae bacterium SAS-127]|nr:helix-turn-helix transcriptional regulator [Bacillaceae bacterium SAS-127]
MNNIVQRFTKLERTSPTSQCYREGMIAELRKVIPFAASCCTMVDPNTLLSTGAITEENVEKIHPLIFKYEFSQNDFNHYDELVHSQTTVAILSEATEGQLERSHRYRTILQPAGFRDELRAVLMSEGKCWGYLTLFRGEHQPLFTKEDQNLLSTITPLVGRALRQYRLELSHKEADHQVRRNGILILSADLHPLSCNAVAEDWLAVLRRLEKIDDKTLPRPIRAICSRALEEVETATAQVFLSIPGHSYLLIRASCLHHFDHSKQIAVSFEPASPSDILPFIEEVYHLSQREKEIISQVIRGFSTKEIAAAFHISAYTVQDHLKSIFYKTGVASRRELVWKMFSQYILK